MNKVVGRGAVLAVLLGAYAGVFAAPHVLAPRTAAFDALTAHGRQIEAAIADTRFAEALPVALDLRQAYRSDPQILYWLGEIYHGLNRPREEAGAWEAYLLVSSAPWAACPAVAEVYERLGESARALAAYERCVAFDPDDPERLIDLAAALERRHEPAKALEVYRRADRLDTLDPRLTHRIQALGGRAAGQ
jgi:tetratricopeptide (TPR) repeat protein